jgi:carboxyl-terminal processing protease
MLKHFLKKSFYWCALVLLLLGFWATPVQALTDEQRLLSEVWRIVDRSYVDYTFNQNNWWQIRQQALKKSLPDRASTYAAIQEMLANLGDPFTRLLRPDQYRSLQTNTSGELTGVGLQVSQIAETGALEVIAPLENSPAEHAGIRPQDHILKIDGISTQNLTLDEAAERMRGKIGTQVILTIQHLSEPPQNLTILRERISLNPLTSELRQTKGGLQFGYLQLGQFNANAAMEVAHAIHALDQQGAAAYLLDLRNNPGGLLQSGIEIARWWLDQGPIVYTVNRQGIENTFEATGQALTQAPLVVLVNQGTASASEILAGALQESGRAKLVGNRTFGKGLIQSLFELSDGSGLAVTVAKYETPLHHDINKLGIQPDIKVEQPALAREQIGTDQDQQYQAAVEVLTQTLVAERAT